MQTFLVDPFFGTSAKILDYRRLGKQRLEAFQLLNILLSDNPSSLPYYNHPVVKMWQGGEYYLWAYARWTCQEWIKRGYKDSINSKLDKLSGKVHGIDAIRNPPFWFSDDRELNKIIRSHKSNLLRKDPIYYGKFNWTEPNDLPYYWPRRIPRLKMIKVRGY